jgi:peroxiredoxin
MPPQTLDEAFSEICVMDAPLNERLAAYSAKLRELEFPWTEAYDDLVARLYAGEVGTTAPAVGDAMPAFNLPSRSGELVSLEDLTGTGPVVVSFNRGHWCPFCKIELKTIAAHHGDIAAHGARVVSIVPELQKFADEIRIETQEKLMILTDVDNGYALSLGLVMWVGENIKALMQGHGYQLETEQGNDGWFLPVPATFVVGKDGRIVARFVDPDFRKRMNIEDILSALNIANRVGDVKSGIHV